MKKYNSMKSSNVLWLGDIPEHWECLKIGILFSQRKVKVSDKDYAPLSVTKMGILPQLESAAKSDDSDNRKLVCAGDFVINSRSDRKGSCGVSELNGSVSLINLVLTPRNEWNNRYVHYLMRSQPFSEEYYRYGRGIVADLWTTRFSEMKNILLPVPPREEQDRIVRFLDWKVSEINRLIHCRKRQIERLEELKKAVVSRAVTRGLNPDAGMKNSGVNWIGNIPEHWEVRFLEQTCHEKCVKNIGNIESNVLSLSYGYIIKKKNVYSGLVANDFSTYQIVQNGDIILRFTDLQNDHKSLRTGLVTQTGIITSAYTCITPTINSAYLRYLLHSYDLRKVFYGMGGGVRQSIGYKDVRHMFVLVPPIEEQQQIAAYLDEQMKKINSAIANQQKQIETLQELKTRLISDVVTGKTDVREIAIPEYVHTEESGEIEESEEVPENGKEEN